MTPVFKIIADGEDITAQIKDRLLELRVTDEAGLKADALEIRLDDREGLIDLPASGAALQVSMGYLASGAAFIGAFVSDEIVLSGPPRVMKIRAQSADMSGAIKEPKTRNWDAVTLKAIVQKIAGEHGLEAAVDDAKGAFTYKHLAQTNESDLHLLTRLAKDHDALAAIKDGNLLFVARGAGKSASGDDLPKAQITPEMVSRWSVALTSRDKYKAVTAPWQDKGKGKKEDVLVGEGDPIYRIRHVYPTQAEAERAASSKLDEFKRGTDSLALTVAGDPALGAETQLELSGFRSGVDGDWSTVSVCHTLNSNGYSSKIRAEKPLPAKAE